MSALALPRLDGSIHDEHVCYECGASSRDTVMDPIVGYNRDAHRAEYRFACHDLTDCTVRRNAMGLHALPVAGAA